MSWNGIVVVFWNSATNTVIDLSGGDSKSGTPVIGYGYHGGDNQRWRFIQVKLGTFWPVYRIQNVATGTFLDLYNGGTDPGTAINGWAGNTTDTANTHQLWRIVTGDPLEHYFRIQNYGSNTYVDLYNGGADNGTKVLGWNGQVEQENSHQIWKILRVG